MATASPPRSSAPPPPPPPNVAVADMPVPRMSPSLGRFAPAFVRVQASLEPVIKNHTNPAFKGAKPVTYADLASILDEALPILSANGFGIMQFPSTENGQLALMSMLIHESGEFVSATMPLLLQKADPQGEGSAISYGRRYAACAILGIRTTDDDGNEASGKSERPSRQAPQQQSKEQKLGWADADACSAAHGAVAAQIKALYTEIPEDHPMRKAIREHRDANGWPMVPDALSALSMMVAKATPPAAQDGQEGAGGSEGAPEAQAPAPEAPSASTGEVCWYCEHEMVQGQPTVIIGGQDADHPAQRMHASCKDQRDAELEEEGRPFSE